MTHNRTEAAFVLAAQAFNRAASDLATAWEAMEMCGTTEESDDYPFSDSFDEIAQRITDWLDALKLVRAEGVK